MCSNPSSRTLERDPESLHNAFAVGLCTGLLPAAVAACSQSLVQVLQLTPETVDIALRLGFEAHRRAQIIEKGDGSWARVVSGLSEAEWENLLSEFHTSSVSPPSHQRQCTCIARVEVCVR